MIWITGLHRAPVICTDLTPTAPNQAVSTCSDCGAGLRVCLSIISFRQLLQPDCQDGDAHLVAWTGARSWGCARTR